MAYRFHRRRGLGDLASIQTLLNQAASKYSIPSSLLQSLAKQESGFNPNATSSAGAQGVMQLMPATAAQLGVADAYDPAENIDAGARYLSQMYQRFGDWSLALAAYNAGPGTVAKYGGVPPYAETQNYVSNVLGGADLESAPTSDGLFASADMALGSGDGLSGMAWLAIGLAAAGLALAVSS